MVRLNKENVKIVAHRSTKTSRFNSLSDVSLKMVLLQTALAKWCKVFKDGGTRRRSNVG